MIINSLIFDSEHSWVPRSSLQEVQKNLLPLIEHLNQQRATLQTTPYAFITAPEQQTVIDQVKQVANLVQQVSPRVLVVIGIGGSNLASRAVQEAVLGIYYNQTEPVLEIYYADTVDTDTTSFIMKRIKNALQKQQEVILNIISKSGSTIETVANAEIFIELLRAYKKDDWHKYVVVTTDKGSYLWHFAQQEKLVALEIPPQLGGRYSAFCPVGLFPLALLGINIDELCSGARSMNKVCLDTDIKNNYALQKAATLFYHYQQGKNIHDMFLFCVNAESIGKWYRQLMAESLGKKKQENGNTVAVGITPTVSIGTIDLHSMVQLYFAGPNQRVTTFVTVQNCAETITLPSESVLSVDHPTGGQTYTTLMHAVVEGVKASYRECTMPFITVTLPSLSAYYLGQLLQLSMFEIVYTAHLLAINPFDQPQVEMYKTKTRHWLEKNRY